MALTVVDEVDFVETIVTASDQFFADAVVAAGASSIG